MADPERREFGRLRLRGGRYEAKGFPVEVLSELTRYEQLVRDVARGMWKQRNPGRSRIPRGFTEGFGLRLTALENGSVVPVLQRETDAQLDIRLLDIFDEAGELIVEAVGALEQDGPLPSGLPESAHPSFLQFGKSLRDDESIELGWGAQNRIYSPTARRRLSERWSVERFPADGSVVGRVTGVDAEGQTFTFATVRDEQLRGRYSDPGILTDLTDVIQARALAPVVRLDGALEWTRRNDPVAITDVRSLELFAVDDEPWADRLITLLSIERGWFDGEGERIELFCVEAARDIMQLTSTRGVDRPGIFPMPDGGVQLEWHTERVVTSIEVHPTLRFTFSSVDLASQQDRQEEISDLRRAVDLAVRALRVADD